ncbi:MAG: hypothetical protein QNK30_02205 [Bacteroidales bacterium]|nr:hypothetical protein [Bacteroidales bacterium]
MSPGSFSIVANGWQYGMKRIASDFLSADLQGRFTPNFSTSHIPRKTTPI